MPELTRMEVDKLESEGYLKITQEEAIKRAIRKGFTIVEGDENTLLLDLDSHYDVDYIKRIFPVFQSYVKCSIKDEWRSKSGKGKHIMIKLEESMPSLERRSFCQAILGSDWAHELLSFFKNYIQEGAESVVLFKPPVNAKK